MEQLSLMDAEKLSLAQTSSSCPSRQSRKTVYDVETLPSCPEGTKGSMVASSVELTHAHDDLLKPEHCKGSFTDASPDQGFLEVRAEVSRPQVALQPQEVMPNARLRSNDGSTGYIAPEASEGMVEQVESHFQNNNSSLLATLMLASTQEASGSKDNITSLPPASWLQWLGLPKGTQLLIDVCRGGVPFLDSLPPVAVADLVEDNKSVALSVSVGEARPEGMLLFASMAGIAVPLSFSSTPSSSPSTSATLSDGCGQAAGSSFTVHLPRREATWTGSQGGMLMIEARCPVSKQVQGLASMLVLPSWQQHVADELLSLAHQGSAQLLAEQQGKEGKDRSMCHFVDAVGWWMDNVNKALSQVEAGEVSSTSALLETTASELEGATCRPEAVEAGADAEKLSETPKAGGADFDLVEVGSWLLNELVKNSLPATADMVLQRISRAAPAGSKYVEALLQGSAHPRRRSLMHLAVLSGGIDMVDQVLRWFNDFKVSYDWFACDSGGMTALHLAVLTGNDTMLPCIVNACPEAQEAVSSSLLSSSLMLLRQKMVRISSVCNTTSRPVSMELPHVAMDMRANRGDGILADRISASTLTSLTPPASELPHVAMDTRANHAEGMFADRVIASTLTTLATAASPPVAESSPPSSLNSTTSFIVDTKSQDFVAFRLEQVRCVIVVYLIMLIMGIVLTFIRMVTDARPASLSYIAYPLVLVLSLAETRNMLVAPHPERNCGKGLALIWLVNTIFMTSHTLGLLPPPLMNTRYSFHLAFAAKVNVEAALFPTHRTWHLPILLTVFTAFLFSSTSFTIKTKIMLAALAWMSVMCRSVADQLICRMFRSEQVSCKKSHAASSLTQEMLLQAKQASLVKRRTRGSA